MKGSLIFCLLMLFVITHAAAQSEKEQLIKARVDTTHRLSATTDSIRQKVVADSIAKNKHIPRKATFRSAVLPGWGQAYNREYWKIPFVYAVIGIPAGFFIFNNTNYQRAKTAYVIRFKNDSLHFPDIHKSMQTLSASDLQYYRNQFRRDRDYSILYFLAAWGLQVADATVFGHLRDFDVSDDLSFKIKPGISELGNTAGLSFVVAVKSPSEKQHRMLRVLP